MEDAPRPEVAKPGAAAVAVAAKPGAAEVAVMEDAPRLEVVVVAVAAMKDAPRPEMAAEEAAMKDAPRPEMAAEVAAMKDAPRPEMAAAVTPVATGEWSSSRPAQHRDEATVAPRPRTVPCRSAAASLVEAKAAVFAPAAPK